MLGNLYVPSNVVKLAQCAVIIDNMMIGNLKQTLRLNRRFILLISPFGLSTLSILSATKTIKYELGGYVRLRY